MLVSKVLASGRNYLGVDWKNADNDVVGIVIGSICENCSEKSLVSHSYVL